MYGGNDKRGFDLLYRIWRTTIWKSHYEEYLKRKAEWERKKKRGCNQKPKQAGEGGRPASVTEK